MLRRKQYKSLGTWRCPTAIVGCRLWRTTAELRRPVRVWKESPLYSCGFHIWQDSRQRIMVYYDVIRSDRLKTHALSSMLPTSLVCLLGAAYTTYQESHAWIKYAAVYNIRKSMQCKAPSNHPLVYRGKVAGKGSDLLVIRQPASLGTHLGPGPNHCWGIMGLGCNSTISSFLPKKELR